MSKEEMDEVRRERGLDFEEEQNRDTRVTSTEIVFELTENDVKVRKLLTIILVDLLMYSCTH